MGEQFLFRLGVYLCNYTVFLSQKLAYYLKYDKLISREVPE